MSGCCRQPARISNLTCSSKGRLDVTCFDKRQIGVHDCMRRPTDATCRMHAAAARVLSPGVLVAMETREEQHPCLCNPYTWDLTIGCFAHHLQILPPKYHSLEDADFSVVPPIMAMNTQSAILIPEPGSTVPQGTEALWVKGYAWCGECLHWCRETQYLFSPDQLNAALLTTHQ